MPKRTYKPTPSPLVMANNAAFLLPAPSPDDQRSRNTFGYLEGFGKAYSAYYDRLDAIAGAKAKSDPKNTDRVYYRVIEERGRYCRLVELPDGSHRDLCLQPGEH